MWIRDRVYSEVNALLAGTANREIEEKYAEVRDKLLLMKERWV